MNKHEPAFVSLAKEVGSSMTLDLTKEGMKTIQGRTQHIAMEYLKDFPPKPVQEQAAVTILESKDPTHESFKVRLRNTIESEAEYETKLAEWNEQCKLSEVSALRSYITARVVFVISKYESDDLVRAIQRVPLAQEPFTDIVEAL